MNSFGRLFRVELFGESHGPAVGAIIDGCPPGLPLSIEDFETDMARRRAGAAGTTPRKETDLVSIHSGVHAGYSTGSPIALSIPNRDTRSVDYDQFRAVPRPGHADFTSMEKYSGYSDPRGSGHFSGRITAGLVAAGVIAKKILPFAEFGTLVRPGREGRSLDELVAEAVARDDSVGAIVEIRVRGLPVGLGEPFFDACESVLAHLLFAVPAVRALEFGDGFAAAGMFGSEHNDPIVDASGRTDKNGAGGINGGISNGNELLLRVAVKPASSIARAQYSYDFNKETMTELIIEGRHDACIALRSAVVLEAATAIGLADLYLIDRGLYTRGNKNPWRQA
ncbi:MAG: chorismate synthase [Treponema sp.]|nr:chorismate synthase [Treponema sp.]